MTPDILDLTRRAVAAGAPEADDNTVIVIPGVSFRSIATGLVYDRATRLPLLSDPSWIGWTLCEVQRRGCDYSICLAEEQYYVSLCHRAPGGKSMEGRYTSREAALVALLEATR